MPLLCTSIYVISDEAGVITTKSKLLFYFMLSNLRQIVLDRAKKHRFKGKVINSFSSSIPFFTH